MEMHVDLPKMTVSGLAFTFVSVREYGRTLQRLPVYIPDLDFVPTQRQAVQRISEYLDCAAIKARAAYFATARGLTP